MRPSSCQSALDTFHELASKEEQKLEGVFQRVEDSCRDLIVLRFASYALSFLAELDYDTIEVRCQEADAVDVSGLKSVDAVSPWSSLIGRPFGWGWVAINQQGYQDGVLLSFGGLKPSVLLMVEASSICVFAMSETSC